MRRRRNSGFVVVGLTVGLVAAACGGSEQGATSTDTDPPTTDTATSTTADATGAPGDAPAGCVESAPEFNVTISASDTYDGAFDVQSATARATPIVPNGDGSLDDLSIPEFRELGEETSLLMFTQYIGDHDFTADDAGSLSGPEPPTDAITLGLTVVPTDPAGLAEGDIVSSADEIGYDAITTFGTVGVFFQPADGVETYFVVNNLDEEQGGTAELLYLDDEWVCIAWDLAGETRNPEDTYRVNGTLLTPYDRATSPFT